MKHNPSCSCPQCCPEYHANPEYYASPEQEAQREVEAFVATKEARANPIPWEYFGNGDPPSFPFGAYVTRIERTEEEAREYAREIKLKAALLELAAKALPKKRGAKKKHTPHELLELMLAVENLHDTMPGKSDKDVIEAHLRQCYKAQSKRESRVVSKEVQSAIKTILNLLAKARKRFRKPRQL